MKISSNALAIFCLAVNIPDANIYTATAFVVRPTTTNHPTLPRWFPDNNHETRLYNQILESLGVYESKIPEELRDEIYKAEANTEAAQNRGKRIALYTVLAILGIVLASFNGFLTEIRASASPEQSNNLYVLEENGFGWVLANPIFKFLFTNKIGGGLCFLFGGGSGLLAEAELDTKRINAEKIYEELERRRQQQMAHSVALTSCTAT